MAQEIGEQYSPSAIGFIGVGVMGYGMATNVRKNLPSSSKLVVCELNQARRDEFIKEAQGHGSVEVAESPKEVAEKCNIIITSLPNGAAVLKVFTDPATGILAADHSDVASRRLYLDTSTIEVSTSLQVLDKIRQHDHIDFLDAPISGGVPSAYSGDLVFMVGGSQSVFEQAKPIFNLMGKSLHYCGKPGAGLAAKQINNYIGYCSYIGLCEGMNAGVKFGLDPKVLADVINASSGSCWNSLNMNPIKGVQPNSSASRDFKGGFKTELAKGVIDMAVQLMDEVGGKHVLGNVVKDVYARAVQSPLCADQESRSIIKLFQAEDGKGLGDTKVE